MNTRLFHTRRRATLRRSIQLLLDVRKEQSDPDYFYSRLAKDTCELVTALHRDTHGCGLSGTRVLDVGGGPGYFAAEFAAQGADHIGLEPDVGEMSAAGITVANSVRGDGMALPFRNNSFDVVYSSNVAEHIPHPWVMGEEMLRVCKPGGLVILSYTVWLGPFGGHETGFWAHYLGGNFARDNYTKKHGHKPKNVFGISLFDVSCSSGIRWASQTNAKVVTLFPRYHPKWAWWFVSMPVFREFFVSNLVIVLQKATPNEGR